MNGLGNLAQTFRSVILGVERHHHCGQCFGSTDVRCGFLAFDMLFAGLQCQAICGALVQVFTQSDDAPGQFAFVFIACSHISGGRSTKAHRQSEALRCAADDIGIQRSEQTQSHKVGNHRNLQSGSVAVFSNAENDVVNFSTANEITAGIPCILYPANTVNKISLSNIPLKNFLAPGSVKSTDYTFVGTLATTSPAGTIFYFANGNQIKKLTAEGSIKAFRAYFASNGQEARLFSVDGIITAINTIKDEIQPDNTPAYNISGQRVSKDYKGIVIKNGKKAIIQ